MTTLLETHTLLDPIEIARPQALEFGSGTVAAVGRFVGGRRALVIADPFNASRVDVLGLAGDVSVFGEVAFEPDVATLDAALAAASQAGPEVVIGFGGGSAMDLAKLVAVLAGSAQTLGGGGRGRSWWRAAQWRWCRCRRPPAPGARAVRARS